MSQQIDLLEESYLNALQFAKSHYENFPTASLFLPKKLRKHVAIIYWFARQADDIADEGNQPAEQKMDLLQKYEDQLSAALNGRPADNFWSAFTHTVKLFNISHSYFYDLLSAFRQDITKTRYASFGEVIDYCARSANPVGRIILELFDIRDSDLIKYSDSICTALQVTNFYQDLSLDWKKNRLYIPLDEIEKFGVDEKIFELKQNNTNFKLLLRHQVERARAFFEEGKKLVNRLPDGLKLQIKFTILGGEEILCKIEKLDYDVLNNRPKLTKLSALNILRKYFLWKSPNK